MWKNLTLSEEHSCVPCSVNYYFKKKVYATVADFSQKQDYNRKKTRNAPLHQWEWCDTTLLKMMTLDKTNYIQKLVWRSHRSFDHALDKKEYFYLIEQRKIEFIEAIHEGLNATGHDSIFVDNCYFNTKKDPDCKNILGHHGIITRDTDGKLYSTCAISLNSSKLPFSKIDLNNIEKKISGDYECNNIKLWYYIPVNHCKVITNTNIANAKINNGNIKNK